MIDTTNPIKPKEDNSIKNISFYFSQDADTNSDGNITLTVKDSQGKQHGTLTHEDVSIDD